MDMIFELLQELAKSLTPGEFILILGIIALTVGVLVTFFLRSAKGKHGILSFLTIEKEEEEEINENNINFSEIKSSLQSLANSATNSTNQLEQLIASGHTDNSEWSEDVDASLKRLDAIERSIAQIKGYFDDLESNLKQKSEAAERDAHRADELHAQIIRTLETTQSRLTRLDDHVREQLSDIKLTNRDFSRAFSDLNRDLAVIENGIQTHFNSVKSIRLR